MATDTVLRRIAAHDGQSGIRPCQDRMTHGWHAVGLT